MKNELIKRHKEMMSILEYCDFHCNNRHLSEILRGLSIDHMGTPGDSSLFHDWLNIANNNGDIGNVELAVSFLNHVRLSREIPSFEQVISFVRLISVETCNRICAVKLNYWNHTDIVIEQDYKDMLKILDYCYFHTHDDELGSLLGGLSIDIWSNHLPADLADYEIWLDSVYPIKDSDIVTKTVRFLERYTAEFEYADEFESTIAFVKSLTEEQIEQIMYQTG